MICAQKTLRQKRYAGQIAGRLISREGRKSPICLQPIAVQPVEPTFDEALRAKLDEWIDRGFGGRP